MARDIHVHYLNGCKYRNVVYGVKVSPLSVVTKTRNMVNMVNVCEELRNVALILLDSVSVVTLGTLGTEQLSVYVLSVTE